MSLLDILAMAAGSVHVLAITGICIHYCTRRAAWARKKRAGLAYCGFCPSFKAMGTAVQNLAAFYRPSISYVLKEEQDETVEDDGNGDPETKLAHFHRQLRRIRQGEQVDQLVLRL
jgi:hypothetical protein